MNDRTLTQDSSTGRGRALEEAPATPFLEVLFHADLRRIGERTGQGALPRGTYVTIGRETPGFMSVCASASRARGLEDRCVSREQLRARFEPPAKLVIEPSPLARLPVERVFLDGSAVFQEIEERVVLQPDSLFAIGRRVLLRFGCGPSIPPDAGRLGMVGDSESMRELRGQIRSAARFQVNVLIDGETGSGKEHVARAIHEASSATGTLVALNMSGLDPSIAGSELFGHQRGAFTGAYEGRDGAFAAACDGTLFLDEIADTPPDIQKKLLRVLEEREFSSLGSRAVQPVTCRVISASNRPLAVEVAEGRFRRDLFERLRTLTIQVPPLRERRMDIPCLFRHFLAALIGEHPELSRLVGEPSGSAPPPVPMELFVDAMRAEWPGNVRELRNYAIAVAAANLGAQSFITPPLGHGSPPSKPHDEVKTETNEPTRPMAEPVRGELDSETLSSLLEGYEFNQVAVAQHLGISRNTLLQWMKRHGIARPKDLTDLAIEAARAQANGDIDEMARLLRVSPRGLRLRLGQAG